MYFSDEDAKKAVSWLTTEYGKDSPYYRWSAIYYKNNEPTCPKGKTPYIFTFHYGDDAVHFKMIWG